MMSLRSAVTIATVLLTLCAAILSLPRLVEPREAHLERIPDVLDPWRATTEAPPSVIPVDPRAHAHLFRTYAKDGRQLWVSVIYYTQQGSNNRPPAQDLLYPARGWTEDGVTVETLPLDDGRTVKLNLAVTRLATQRYAVLYWYQVGSQSLASDHLYRGLILYNRLIHRRTEGALVRLIMPLDEGRLAAVRAEMTEFLRLFQPKLIGSLPR